jgi:Tol biopolymer transport system component
MKRTFTLQMPLFCLWVLAIVNLPAAFGQIDYLGQVPPQNQAVLFAKGIVSTDAYEHSAPAFSPDGTRVLWTIMRSDYTGYLVEMTYANGQWSKPAPPSFASTDSDDYYPVFSADGQTLHFAPRRKFSNETAKNEKLRLWKVARKGEGWDTPVPMDETFLLFKENFGHSVAESGTVYFSFPEPGGKMLDIAYAKKTKDGFAPPQKLMSGISTERYEDGPFIAPDESYLIFESNRPEGMEGSIDLYICFKQKTGEWGKPLNMGPEVNSKFTERFAKVSPDGKYLFFGSNRGGALADIYWISATVIDQLKKEWLKTQKL